MAQVHRHRQMPSLIPMQAPEAAAIRDACRVLTQQQRAAYQRLYAAGLTIPGSTAAPFKIERSTTHLACLEVDLNICATTGTAHSEYTFLVQPSDILDGMTGVVAKCELIIEALEADRQPVHTDACCPLAAFRSCVCRVSFSCQLHGIHCHGTHD